MYLLFRRSIAVFLFAAAVVCCYWSIRLGWADWLNGKSTLAAVQRSVALAPGNSTYLEHAADLTDSAGGDGTPLRIAADAANPLDSANWIRLATQAEVHGRAEEAERDLLRAYDVDRQFEPRWALANFYYRRGDHARSLAWARKALEFGRSVSPRCSRSAGM